MTKKFENGGEELKKVREEVLKLTQRELAEKFKVHPQMVSNWERGICSPPNYMLLKMYKGLPNKLRLEYVTVAVSDASKATKAELAECGFLKTN